jgi:4-amino-4-deoxy-L-arabinose transferase-like glycosyltransferase
MNLCEATKLTAVVEKHIHWFLKMFPSQKHVVSYGHRNIQAASASGFPLKLLILPLLLGGTIVLLNLQWLCLYQLINAPTADSLVYLTEAYNDYWTLRGEGIGHLLEKYLAGNQHNSPLLWWLAGIAFLLKGVEPANAYLVLGLAYLAWIVGVAFLAWQLKSDKTFALACGLMAVFLPSAVRHGLRAFMLDFVAAAPFVWSTVLLLKSDLFSRRKYALLYGLFCGITVLCRTSSASYFLGHVAIMLYLSLYYKRLPHFQNVVLAGLVAFITCGWFVIANISRIIDYYGYWAHEALKTQASSSFPANFAFYLKLLPDFHFSTSIFRIYVLSVFVALAALLFMRFKLKRHLSDVLHPLVVLILLAGVPTAILSLYPSRAATVDYPFIVAYLVLPVLLWRTVIPQSGLVWVALVILIGGLAVEQSHYLFRSPTRDSRPVDFREREALRMILDDAEWRGLAYIKLGNTCIHQHNSLSYKYWILANSFPAWRGRTELAAIGRAGSAKQLAAMNADCDYVITLDNYQEVTHPNNRFAPEANEILRSYGMQLLGQPLDLPDGTILKILRNPNKIHLNYPASAVDGWNENLLTLHIDNAVRQDIELTIKAELFPLHDKEEDAIVNILSEETGKSISFSSGYQVQETVVVPGSFFDARGKATLILSSSWSYQPENHPENPEHRALAFRHSVISAKRRESGRAKNNGS